MKSFFLKFYPWLLWGIKKARIFIIVVIGLFVAIFLLAKPITIVDRGTSITISPNPITDWATARVTFYNAGEQDTSALVNNIYLFNADGTAVNNIQPCHSQLDMQNASSGVLLSSLCGLSSAPANGTYTIFDFLWPNTGTNYDYDAGGEHLGICGVAGTGASINGTLARCFVWAMPDIVTNTVVVDIPPGVRSAKITL